MSNESDRAGQSAQAWQDAAKRSWLRWPAGLALGGTLAVGANLLLDGDNGLTIGSIHLRLSDAFWIFATLAVAVLPVWYHVTGRHVRGKPAPGLLRQLALLCALWLAALALCPGFAIEHRLYDDYNDVRTTWIKRSPLEALGEPRVKIDQLAWLQGNYSASYVPPDVFCPYRSVRHLLWFGFERIDDPAQAVARQHENDVQTRPDVVKTVIAHCRAGGAAMLQAGLTKETALLRGDLDLFFERAKREQPLDESVVLEDAAIPAPIRSKVESFLAQQESAADYLTDSSYTSFPGLVRRLKPSAIAAALQRTRDVEALRPEQ